MDKHIEVCKQLHELGVTKGWEFDVHNKDTFARFDKRDNYWVTGNGCPSKSVNAFPIGGDRLTNFLVEWLRDRDYKVEPISDSKAFYISTLYKGALLKVVEADSYTKAVAAAACLHVKQQEKNAI